MSLKTAWLNLQDSLGNRFAWSHVNAVYYNWAQKKLLKEKLDDIDTAINAKVAKTDIVQVESTSQSTVPSSAYLKSVKDALDAEVSQLTNGLALIQPVHAAINTFEELFATDQQKNGLAKTVVLDWNSSISPDGSDALIFVWGWSALAFSEGGGIYATRPSDNKWNLRLKRVSGSDVSEGVWAGIDIGTLTGNPYRIYATQTAIGFQELDTQGSVIRQVGTVNFSDSSSN